MTEEDWLTCPDPGPMLRALMRRKVSDRKLRLFAVACARRVTELYPTDRELEVLDLAMLMADQRVPERDLTMARRRVLSAIGLLLGPAADAADLICIAATAARGFRVSSSGYAAERAAQTDLLREIFGNPASPAEVDLSCLPWGRDLILGLAQGIYEDRTFRRIPILADALEEAGCSDVAILDHLRGPGPHVRGCWAIDALTGRS